MRINAIGTPGLIKYKQISFKDNGNDKSQQGQENNPYLPFQNNPISPADAMKPLRSAWKGLAELAENYIGKLQIISFNGFR